MVKTEKEIKQIVADCKAERDATKFGNVRTQLQYYMDALEWTLDD